jgi:hypothetical protein
MHTEKSKLRIIYESQMGSFEEAKQNKNKTTTTTTTTPKKNKKTTSLQVRIAF